MFMSDFSNKQFGERLREVRMNRDITQQNMADELCIELRSYQNYEAGDRSRLPRPCVPIAMKLDVSMDYLFWLSDEDPAGEC